MIAAADGRTLTEREAKSVLALYGVPVVGERLAETADAAVAAAEALGYPVVLKVELPDLPHKTEAGVIRLNLRNADEVRAGYDAVMASASRVSPPPRINGVLVQPMVPQGVEMVVGARIDPLFGPLVVVGLGGILVEVLQDTALAPAPVTHADARAMLRVLKGEKLLHGFRGAPAVDLDKLADVICSISRFAADHRDSDRRAGREPADLRRRSHHRGGRVDRARRPRPLPLPTSWPAVSRPSSRKCACADGRLKAGDDGEAGR